MTTLSEPSFVGIILAGGKSRRMGQEKARLMIQGQSMLSLAVNAFAGAARHVFVVHAQESALPEDVATQPSCTFLIDERPNEGPLMALHTGLTAAMAFADLAFVTTCDAPFLQPALTFLLIQKLVERPSDQAAVPCIQGRWQPLTAAYRTNVRTTVKTLLDTGERRVRMLMDHLRFQAVSEEDLRPADAELLSFLNINTPEEYDQALARYGKSIG